MRRVVYFLITNLAILIIFGTVIRLLGIEPYLTSYGINYQSLLIFAALFGMGGAFISLALSKWTAKRLSGAEVITTPSNEREGWLIRTVSDLAQAAGIEMPEVGIYSSEDMNAFATGMRKNSSLVAVSSGLLYRKASINKQHLPDEMAAFGISGTRKRGLAALFATHPHLEDKIRALQESAYPD
ncbi:MAG: M48 family metalloprotease [Deltaproteobacteria bacterium]|nr:M48 family metalloprotease [Deltaproteobacteria bacterium]